MNDEAQAVVSKASLRLLPFMFLLYIVSYLDRINISFAGRQMSAELGFTADIFGFCAGIFFLGYFLFGVPSNMAMEKVGARRWMSLIMAFWGLISAATGFVGSAPALYLLRFLLGAAEAGFFPGMIVYLTYWFPRRQQGAAVAKFMSAIPVATIAGSLVSSALLNLNGVAGLAGWQWLFLLTGTPAVLLGLLVWFYLPDGPQDAPWLNSDERRCLSDLLLAESGANGAQTEGKNPLAALGDRRVWFFAGIYFLMSFGMYGFQLWLPQILQSFGKLNDVQTALLTAVPAIFQALGMVAVASSSDRTGERRAHLSFAATVAAAGLIASAVAANPLLALLALSISAFGIWGTVGPFWAQPAAALSKARAAAGIAFINSVGNLGGFAGPYAVGLIKATTHQFAPALAVMAASLLLAALLSLASRQPAPAAADIAVKL